jgi:hypothetical protein
VSAVLIRAALEVALAAMSPAVAIAYENKPYTPVPGTPYHAAFLLFAPPANDEIGRAGLYRQDGIFQITLAYPLDAGTGVAAARAELIRTIFYRGASFTASGVTVNIERTPEIAPSRIEEDRFILPVKVRFYSHLGG